MRKRVKIFSTAILLFGILIILPIHPLAETNVNDAGKLQIKEDRIGQDDAQIQQMGSQDYSETELEKIAPDLFKDQTQSAIKEKQKTVEEEPKKITQKLFASSNKHDTALKDMEKVLFADNYSAQTSTAPNEMSNNSGNSGISNKVLASFGLVIIAFCSGIYFISKKWLG